MCKVRYRKLQMSFSVRGVGGAAEADEDVIDGLVRAERFVKVEYEVNAGRWVLDVRITGVVMQAKKDMCSVRW